MVGGGAAVGGSGAGGAGMGVGDVVEAEVVCGKEEAFCICILKPHPDTVHECACGGSWDEGPPWRAIRWPPG